MTRDLSAPAFPDDDGTADATLRSALATGDTAGILGRLDSVRLLVPVVAVLGEVEYDDQGLARDKSSDMAAVLLTKPTGEKALLAFTGLDSMRSWNPDARPVPVPAQVAAQSALQEEAQALVIDLAGPHPFALEADDLVAVAAGHRLVEIEGRLGWLSPS